MTAQLIVAAGYSGHPVSVHQSPRHRATVSSTVAHQGVAPSPGITALFFFSHSSSDP